ncbi:hydroxyethylthiazole kinase [Leadbettera azotonutricia]|uniref:Hydroxyethylthiazole kinase n=1 Tax=Leadbettera azotonutricia (strain ATCC BAA-888 / DSM 13862 / ZAS-9) TaxID=545695 RepID=F5YE30_LEAAZ|nr:hydroxyethylthiazole kinase [Leadbettera azotonutricia]AEF83231.1 hydroxyethylthiazole kinase [Leadbettera azotonutricia ZAS-9]
MITAQSVYRDLAKIREQSPLVHNITNFVVMNNTANALLAIGASPVMAHAEEEAGDMAAIASALVINIGTLSPVWIRGMEKAMAKAAERGIPVVFDPVGAGATPYRSETCSKLLSGCPVSIIRGNASEINALVFMGKPGAAKTKGVDSTISSDSVSDSAKALSSLYNCVVSLSGATDYIVKSSGQILIHNGHPLMPRVTGLGCTATALTGAFAAVNSNYMEAAAEAMAVMGIAGELAARNSKGPGSFQVNFLDALYNLSEGEIQSLLKAE